MKLHFLGVPHLRLRMRAPQCQRQRQRGMTLVELLVAMVLGLLIALAAAAALLVSRQGFTTVDAASQLRDNSRFVRDVVQQLVVQTGYRNDKYISAASPTPSGAPLPPPNIFGTNNRSHKNTKTWRESVAHPGGDIGKSDILVLRYQSVLTPDPTKSDGTMITDGTMIDCMGNSPLDDIPENANQKRLSILYVANDNRGEPSLMCASGPHNDLLESKPAGTRQPLISGVENFQVLYGVDGVAPGNVAALDPATADSVPDRYLRADQLTIVGNESATNANWSRVRSVHIGMVLRGAPGSAAEKAVQTYFPFGKAKSSDSGAAGSAYASSDDPGTTFTAPADGRLRQTLSFTIHLRNYQESR